MNNAKAAACVAVLIASPLLSLADTPAAASKQPGGPTPGGPTQPAGLTQPPGPPAAIAVAHSALLTVNATTTSDGLALHILHANNQIPIDGRDVTLLVDGKNQPLTVAPETGTFLLITKDIGEGVKQFDITVAHDGIREILTGKIEVPKTGSVADLWQDHKQMAWWVLNIVIVLIAVLAFSRRSSKPDKDDDEAEDE